MKRNSDQTIHGIRRKAILTAAFFLFFAGMQMKPARADEVKIDKNNFPDAAFREYVAENCDTVEKDGVLSDEEIGNVTAISIYLGGIKSLEGIEYFTALTHLYCEGNNLTSVDLSKNIALTSLNLARDQLSSLDVSKNTLLTRLSCTDNQLTSLDVSKNTKLKRLSVQRNSLRSLDVKNNTKLNWLYCNFNQLSSLDLSKNTSLTKLYCNDNNLKSLDVSKNTKLYALYCKNNLFSSVDVTGLSLSEDDGTREENSSILKVVPKQGAESGNGQSQDNSDSQKSKDEKKDSDPKKTEQDDETKTKPAKAGDQFDSKFLKTQKGNKSIPENASFTIIEVSSDGKIPGSAAFDGVEDENADAVAIPKVIYVGGVPYNVTTVSVKSFEKATENAGYKVTDNHIDSLAVEYTGLLDTEKAKPTVSVPKEITCRGIRFKATGIAKNAFRKNAKVTKVKIAASVSTIGAGSFEGCSNLKTVIIGKGMTQIGKNAFKNCKNLKSIQLKGKKLKKVGKTALKGVNAKCRIKVPKDQVKAYTKLFKGKGQKKSVKVVKG